MGVLGYRWEPDGGLYAVDGDRVVGVLESALSGDPAQQRLVLARRLIADAESRRLVRDRPPAMLDALAAGFAAQRLERAPAEPLHFTVDEILQWIDGPGLDVLLGFVLSRRAR